MGYQRWKHDDWLDYSRQHTAGRTRQQVFARHNINPEFDPRHIGIRESRDSKLNPESNAIIVAFDETGSMGSIPDHFVREGLNTMISQILDYKPVSDPHVMVMGVGDAWCDRAPLQVTQFEADIRIAQQLKDIYLEGGGGGNQYESYNLPWFFAAQKTSIDCYEKRGKKGYLFTVGDEPPPPVLKAQHIQDVFGLPAQSDIPTSLVLKMASEKYQVFHVVIEQGSYFQSAPSRVQSGWNELLGQNVLYLPDYRRLAEQIVSTIADSEGNREFHEFHSESLRNHKSFLSPILNKIGF